MVKKRLVAFFLAFALLFGAFLVLVPATGKTAQALDENGPKSLYYFKEISDYGGHYEEEMEVIALGQTLKDEYLIDEFYYDIKTTSILAAGEESWILADLKKIGGPNTYLILDLDQVLRPNAPNRRLFISYLEETLSTLKSEDLGCKIMLICGADENFFWAHHEFLQYVDIHVNTDTYEVFFINVIYHIYAFYRNSFEWENMTFFLNRGSQYEFFEGRVKTMLENTYSMSLEEICDNRNIHFLMYDWDNTFYDLQTGDYYPNEPAAYEEILNKYFYGLNVFAVGYDVYDDPIYDSDWQNAVKTMQEQCGFDFTFFQFEEDPQSHPTIPTYVGHGPYDITFLIEAFLRDEDLINYNNWYGKCNVTHKAFTVGPNGWMYAFDASGDSDFAGMFGYDEEEL